MLRPLGRPPVAVDGPALVERRFMSGRASGVELLLVFVAMCLYVIGLIEIVGNRWHSPWPVAAVDLALMTVPLVLVSTQPVVTAVLAAAALTFECAAFTTPQSLAVFFAGMAVACGVARYARGRVLAPALLILACVQVVVALRDPTNENQWDYLFTFAIWAAAGLVGLLLRARHTAVANAVGEAVRLRTGQRLAIERAVSDERIRLARDLHDVVAHAVSLMVIQAAAGRAVLAQDPGRTRETLDTIESTGQRALGDLHRLLGVLRSEQRPDSGHLPGLAGLDRLAEEARNAGLPCRVRRRGSLDQIPESIEVAAYRIVQESLTNALKHGPGRGVEIVIGSDAGGLRVMVLDRSGPSVPAGHVTGGGRGIGGMRERVAMYGGTLTTGPQVDGWRVEARFPLGAAP